MDTAVFPKDRKLIRIASDELLIYPALDEETAVADDHAIIVTDGSFAGVKMAEQAALSFLAHSCEWEPPSERPAFAQGAVGGIATKMLFEEGEVFFIVPAAMAVEFEGRW